MVSSLWAMRFLLLSSLLTHFGIITLATEYVIGISVDGLVTDAVEFGNFTTLARIIHEGATTEHARTDYDFTNTLPNHACMLTSKPAKNGTLEDGTPYEGHGYTDNIDVGKVFSESVFDVVHASGGRTAMFASKTKFAVYERSWNMSISHSDIDINCTALVEKFILELETKPYEFAFLHIADPDRQGHANGWLSKKYLDAVQAADEWIDMILAAIHRSSRMRDKTAIIITSDHGGIGNDHAAVDNPAVYNIPFYVWGSGAGLGYDLYEMNPTRLNPNPVSNISMRPGNNEDPPPIRNGDLGNLALQLLGLRPIQNSLWDSEQDLILDESSSAPSISPTVVGSYEYGSYEYSYGSYEYGDSSFGIDLSAFPLVDPSSFSTMRQPTTASMANGLRRLRTREP